MLGRCGMPRSKMAGSRLPARANSSANGWARALGQGLGWPRAAGARQHDGEFGELARSALDVDPPAVLLDDDVVGHRQAEPRTLARWLGGEERVEHLFLHFGRNASAVVADANFHGTA